MRQFFKRTAAWTLSVTLALGVAVVPCAADDAPAKAKAASLTRLSPASQQLLAKRAQALVARAQDQPGASTPSSFFRSKRGAVTLALMGAGTVFTIWSINHDRKPVKSPVR